MKRRDFVLGSLSTAAGVGLIGLGLGLYSQRAASLPAWTLRPPGALPEADFDGACIRCGLCVRDCPYDTLHLAAPGEPVATGTPYFVARKVPCEMCEDIPCVKACPTGALDPALTDIDGSRMGLAVLIDQENCLNYQGLRCDVCYRVCPAINQAISGSVMSDFVPQAQAVAAQMASIPPGTAGMVTVLLGNNDVCASSIEAMTDPLPRDEDGAQPSGARREEDGG